MKKDLDKAYANAVAKLREARSALHELSYQLDCASDDLSMLEHPKPFAADAMRTRAGMVWGFTVVIDSTTTALRRQRKEVAR